ncbi:hypothetical protein GE09DRAFT_1215752 [Coniochaeta sp. 2T2.1]|nr:hypothetical protein GE09DRAFT_1215752 [Coniochaeta sp. 2T2.1]
MAAPIPIAIYGRDGKIAEAIRELLLPDIDVVHTSLTLSSASTELPLLLSGALSTAPSSGLGSNASRPESDRLVPRAVFFGGGVPEEEVQLVQRLVLEKLGLDGAKGEGGPKFLRVTREEVLAAGAKGPDPGVIAGIYRRKVEGL